MHEKTDPLYNEEVAGTISYIHTLGLEPSDLKRTIQKQTVK